MNRILLHLNAILSVLICTWTLSAQDYDTSSYAPLTKGMVLKYNNLDSDGKVSSSYVITIKEVEGTFAKGRIVMHQEFFDNNGTPLFKDNNVPMEVITGGKNTVTKLDDAGKIMKVQDMMSKGDASSIPATLKTGTTIPDGIVEINIGMVSAKILTSERKVTDAREISTPAGKFKCFMIEENQCTKTIVSKNETVKTWYAKGIGCVKQEVYDKKGRLTNTQVLQSISFTE